MRDLRHTLQHLYKRHLVVHATVFETLLRALLPLVARLVIIGLADKDQALDGDEDLQEGRVGGPDFGALWIENGGNQKEYLKLNQAYVENNERGIQSEYELFDCFRGPAVSPFAARSPPRYSRAR